MADRPIGGTAGIVVLASLGLYFLAPTAPVPAESLVAVPLTSLPGTESHPSLSPDGKQVAFVRGYFIGGDIMVRQIGATDGVPLEVTDSGRDTGPVWSADGSSIFFLRVVQAPWLEEFPEGRVAWVKVCSVPALGGPVREWARIRMSIAEQFNATPYLAAAPGGKSVVVAGHPESEEGRGLYMLSLETRDMHPLTEPPDVKSADSSPCFSPDGRTLAFFRSSGLGGDIHTLSFDERSQPAEEPERLHSITGVFTGLAWDQEGKEIIYSSGTVKDWQLRRIPTATVNGNYLSVTEMDRMLLSWFPRPGFPVGPRMGSGSPSLVSLRVNMRSVQ